MKNKKEWVDIQNSQNIIYHEGNICYRNTYKGKVFRYRIYKIDTLHLNKKTWSLLKDDEKYDVQQTVKSIDKKILEIHSAFNALSQNIGDRETIKKKDIDEYISMKSTSMKPKANYGLVTEFEQWIKEYNEKKRQELKNRGQNAPSGTLPGTKDFVSCLNLLRDFEYDNFISTPIKLKDVNTAFINDLIEYCYDERVSDEKHTYNTRGNLVNKTLQKRLDSLFQFLNDITEGNLPYEIKKPHLDVIDRQIIRLDTQELKQLQALKLNDPHDEKIRDYFLFLCYTGLRFADFYKLDSTFFDIKENILKLKSNKTFSDCQIYLCSMALNIANKYKWHFHDYTNQALNRALHTLFEDYDLFGELITMEYMQSGRKTYTKKKRDLITCHSARRTFISRLIEQGADIYDVMSMTGHKKVETLKFYIDKFGLERKKRLIGMINDLQVQ